MERWREGGRKSTSGEKEIKVKERKSSGEREREDDNNEGVRGIQVKRKLMVRR